MGRRAAISPEALQGASAAIAAADIQLDSADKKRMKQHLQDARSADIVSRGGNNHVALPALSGNTQRKYFQQLAPAGAQGGVYRTDTRSRALCEIQSSITAHAIYSTVEDIDPALQVSIDAFSTKLGRSMDDKPKVFLAQG